MAVFLSYYTMLFKNKIKLDDSLDVFDCYGGNRIEKNRIFVSEVSDVVWNKKRGESVL